MYQQHNVRNKLSRRFSVVVAILGLMAISDQLYAFGDDSVPATIQVLDNKTPGGGLYVSASVGQSKSSLDCMDVSDFDPGASGCTDNRGNAIALSVGLQFHPNIAVEFGYVNLGKFGASAVGTELGVPLSESADYKAKGFQATLVGIIPVSKQVDILGRIGVFRWDWNLTSTGIEGGVPFSRDETTHGTDVTYGIGAQYNVSKNISARLEWQRFQNVGDQPMNGQTNIDMFSLGLVYRFK